MAGNGLFVDTWSWLALANALQLKTRRVFQPAQPAEAEHGKHRRRDLAREVC